MSELLTPEEFVQVVIRERDLLLRIREREGVLASVEVLRREIPFLSSADIRAIVEGLPNRPSAEGLRYLSIRECSGPWGAAIALHKQCPRSNLLTTKKAVDALPNESRLNAIRAAAKRIALRRGAVV